MVQDKKFSAFEPTPLYCGGSISEEFGLGVDLRIKRDDLFPMAGGGIKARKIQFIWRDVVEGGHRAVVTTGGPQSNHARATAIMAAQYGIRCHLVVTLEEERIYSTTGNILLMKLSGADIEYVKKTEIAERMDAAMRRFKDENLNPLYIWGGGHTVSGTEAFIEAAKEAQGQCGDWHPDYLIFASATGTTHAGFALGYERTNTRVIGISVARSTAQGKPVVHEAVKACLAAKNDGSRDVAIEFLDDWTDGGYEKTSDDLMQTIRLAATRGLFVDPTYSGKALRGLVGLVRRGTIERGSKVLFWHTGGLMNLLASDLAQGELSL
jgi:D-cysteine desulfhydrase